MPIMEMQKFKEKYPVYKDIPDERLLQHVVKKFPVYAPIAEREFGAIKETRDARTVLKKPAEKVAEGVKKAVIKHVTTPLEIIGNAMKEIDRPFGLVRSLVAGKQPLEGFKYPDDPEKSPPFADSVLRAAEGYGLSKKDDPTQAFWVSATGGFAAELGTMYLAFNTFPKAIGTIAKQVDLMKNKAQVKAFNSIVDALEREFKLAGMAEAEARQAAKTAGWTAYQKAPKTSPSAMYRASAFLRANEGKISSIMRRAAANAKDTAAKQGFTEEWMRKATEIRPSLPVEDAYQQLLRSREVLTRKIPERVQKLMDVPLHPAEAGREALKKIGPEPAKLRVGKLKAKAISSKVEQVKKVVEKAGGKWVGVQEGFKGEDLAMFNDPKTKSTLAIPVSQVTEDAVKAKLAPAKPKVERIAKLKEIREKMKPAPIVAPQLSETPKPPPKIAPEAVSPKIDNVKPIGVEAPKPETPVRKELRKPPKRKLVNVELQTLKGATSTVMYEEDLNFLKEQIRKAPETKIQPKHGEIPVVRIIDEYPVNIKDVHLGVSPMPIVKKVMQLYDYVERVTDPVRTAPSDVARLVRRREIDQNVLIHNVYEVKKAMQQMVPNPRDQELITKYIEPGGEEFEDQMSPNMLIVAELIKGGQERIGKLAQRHGVVREVLSNYMKHLVRDKELTLEEMDAKIRWAMSTDKISKYVESKHPRVRTEDGEIMFPTIASLEAAGYEVITKNALDLYEYTMRSEGIATINAELVDNLAKVPYVDPRVPTKKLFHVMSMKPGEKLPRGFRIMRKGVFTMKLASPEVYPALSSVAEPAIGGKFLRWLTGITKQIKFLLPFYHGWNFWRNSVEARGLIMGTKLFFDGAKRIEDPRRVSEILKMGVNLFRINKMSGAITEEFLGKEHGFLFNIHEKMTEALFVGMGDSLTAGLVDLLENQLKATDFTTAQKHEIIAEITNTLSGNLDPSSMSRATRDIGRIALLARNWTISNIREGVGAFLGKMPPHWSPAQAKWGAKWYRSALLRAFSQLFAVANIINWLVSKHSYGEGRFCWENQGKWERKIQPLIWVDKNTGKEYYITNMYGSMGDILHWMTRPWTTLEHKLMIPIRETFAQVNNRDTFTGERIWRDSDNLVQGVAHRLAHAGESFLTPAGLQQQKGLYPIPIVPKILRVFGLAIGSGAEDADMLKKMRDFNEKKRYRVREIDKRIYKAIAERDLEEAENIASEQMRYQHPSSLRGLLEKFKNPVKHFYFGLGRKGAREFEDTLSEREKEELNRILRK